MKEEHKKVALKLLEDFNKDAYVINQGKRQSAKEFAKERPEALNKIRTILEDFFSVTISLEIFKKNIDSLNKKNPYWGFKGANGQMFFNMLYNSSSDKKALKNLLIDVLRIPNNIQDAKNKINKVIKFIKINSKEIDKRKLPKVKSVLYFISYFWQIQHPKLWPIFYNSLEQTLIELNILDKIVDLAEYYEDFYNLNLELLNLFKKNNTEADLWFVEHVFWKYYLQQQEVVEPTGEVKKGKINTEYVELVSDYIPPVISNIMELSLTDSNPADFEKKVLTIFQMIGFEVELMGQGKGRVVDVIARANLQKPYILLIDCKARSKKDFRLNAGEERTIIEYIKNFSNDYPKDSKLETHYLIVSSGFRNDDEDVRRKIKGETGTDISFIAVQELLFLFVKKLQNWDLDLDRMRVIFQREGLITKDVIQDIIGR